MKCPNCNVSLVISDRSGVEIDYCPDCRGVWLDRGELDKIIERSVQESVPLAPQQSPQERQPHQSHPDFRQSHDYSRDYKDSKYYKQKKYKSFFSLIL